MNISLSHYIDSHQYVTQKIQCDTKHSQIRISNYDITKSRMTKSNSNNQIKSNPNNQIKYNPNNQSNQNL